MSREQLKNAYTIIVELIKLYPGVKNLGWMVGRPIEGITLNPLEWLLDDDGKIRYFETKGDAVKFLTDCGFTEDDICEITFKYSVRCEHCGTACDICEDDLEQFDYIQCCKCAKGIEIATAETGNELSVRMDFYLTMLPGETKEQAERRFHDIMTAATNAVKTGAACPQPRFTGLRQALPTGLHPRYTTNGICIWTP
ncbi:MAG: hypothetical protein GXY05_03470 [Clostridiales bacterium]|nr:hypothetical protein [Clostridiales bacterium]